MKNPNRVFNGNTVLNCPLSSSALAGSPAINSADKSSDLLHPLRRLNPICLQSQEAEESWWARVFAERGIPDPARGDQLVAAAVSAETDPLVVDDGYWEFVMQQEGGAE